MKERIAAVKNPDTRNDLSKRAKVRLLMVNLSTCYIKPKPLASDQERLPHKATQSLVTYYFFGLNIYLQSKTSDDYFNEQIVHI